MFFLVISSVISRCVLWSSSHFQTPKLYIPYMPQSLCCCYHCVLLCMVLCGTATSFAAAANIILPKLYSVMARNVDTSEYITLVLFLNSGLQHQKWVHNNCHPKNLKEINAVGKYVVRQVSCVPHVSATIKWFQKFFVSWI